MANKKQRGLELSKTEARLSGIPKGASTLKGMTDAEKKAYELSGYLVGGTGAAKLLAKGVGKVRKLAQTAKARRLAKKEIDTKKSARQETEANNLIKKAQENINFLESALNPKSFLRLKKMPKSEQKKIFNRIGTARQEAAISKELSDIEKVIKIAKPEADKLLGEVLKKSKPKLAKKEADRLLGEVTKKNALRNQRLREAKFQRKVPEKGKPQSFASRKEKPTQVPSKEDPWYHVGGVEDSHEATKRLLGEVTKKFKANKRPPTSKKKGGTVKKKVKKGYVKKYANGGSVRKVKY